MRGSDGFGRVPERPAAAGWTMAAKVARVDVAVLARTGASYRAVPTGRRPADFSAARGTARIRPVKKAPTAPSPDDLIRGAGLRRTPGRVGVLGVLAAAGGPLDVPTIVGRLPGQTDVVTVYRTLNTFTRKGLVHRVRGEGRSWRYAPGRPAGKQAHPHPHFVCDDCGKVVCLNGVKIPTSLTRTLAVDGYTVDHPEVVLHGTCPKCH